MSIARSACGVKTIGMSARSNERCVNVDSTATFVLGAERRRSVTRDQRMGCISAMFEPHSTNASATSKSS